MRCRLIMFCLLAAGCSDCLPAQTTISSVQPRSCQPGQTTKLVLTGKNLNDALRVITDTKADVKIESAAADEATVAMTLPADTSLGPMLLFVASSAGPAEPLVLIVDDLPIVADNGKNHSPATAQEISTLTAIEGKSDGAKSDFFRFQVTAGQRVAFEILTQPLGSNMDPLIRLMAGDGQQIRLSDDDEVGPDCRFSHVFPQSGEFLIEVRDSRYQAGGHYHLRLGDFPILAQCHPSAVQRGHATKLDFVSSDNAHADAQEITIPADFAADQTLIATRLADGQSSAWLPLRVSDTPQHVEAESAHPPLHFPIGISGRLMNEGAQDEFTIQGVKDQTVRFTSHTRSLRSRVLLKMQLFNTDGTVVAATKVSDTDEWSFDYTFPDDSEYRLQVTDLLGRGGPGFGYFIDVAPMGTFGITLKADAKTRELFSIEETNGACVIELQIQRAGYDGVIDLLLDQSATGLSILNPVIASKAQTAKIYVVVDDQWKETSVARTRIKAQARSNPAISATTTSLALHRIKKPHVPFPTPLNDGVVLMSGVAGTDSYFTIEPASALQFAKPVKQHIAQLNLKRLDEKFKSAVTILSHRLPAGWSVSAKAEKDHYTATFTRNNETNQPEQIPVLVYAEHDHRGRIETTSLPVKWIDPISVSLTPAAPLVAGNKNRIVARVLRQGGDPQPVTIKLSNLPAGVEFTDEITIEADNDQLSFELELPPAVTAGDIAITFSATSTYEGNEFSIEEKTPPLAIVPAPQRVEVIPTQITLTGTTARRQLIVTGYDESNTPRDWTRDAVITSANPNIVSINSTVAIPQANGETQISIQAGDHTITVPVRVAGMETKRATAMESEVLVALSKQGCNSGACHGSPSGKGMFRLSLRAFDRKLDELTLIREDFGRRVNRIDPEQSLLLLKPTMKVSHGGGKQLRKSDAAYAILRDWIAEGAKQDPADVARCVRLEVFPAEKRILNLATGGQQVSVLAHFSDDSVRDVTHLVAYESSNTSVATVDEHGLVTPTARGESAILVRFLEHIESIPVMFIQPDRDFQFAALAPLNYVDELINAKLQQLQYLPSTTCNDSEFLRRVHLDVIGVLPTVAETTAFLADASDDKRSRLIDNLLQRDEYAKYWALKWGDLLKMTGKLVGDEGVYKYHRWVEEAFRSNMPYDQFAASLLSASGSTLANPPANFYRTATNMNECVETVSQVFLGARLQCAKCHNHPFERWTQDNYYGLGAFFHRLQRRQTQRPGEMFVWTSTTGEVTQPRTGQQMQPWLPHLGDVSINADDDRRGVLVDWLVKPDNPYFARIEANRIWSQFFSRGIVDPIDDFRDSNPPSNSLLLDALAKDFAEHGFDRKHLIRTILNSRTYQASYEPNDSNRADTIYFSHQRPRLLSAEQLLDAVNHLTGLDQTYGNLPAGTKATHLPAPDLVKIDFLKVFGQPERSTVCACERADDSNLGMAIELFNGPTIHKKLADAKNRFRTALANGTSIEAVLEDLYMAGVCRQPNDAERKAAIEHCRKREHVSDGLEDVCWALLNTDEFLFQH